MTTTRFEVNNEESEVEAVPVKKPKAEKVKGAVAATEFPSFRSAVVEALSEDFAKIGAVIDTSDELRYTADPKNFIKTGIYHLDYILSGGRGLPCGRFIEVFGNEGAGKSAIAEFLASRVHKIGGTVHDIDTERTREPAHFECYGINPETDILSPDLPDLESVWDYIRGVVHTLEERNEQRAKVNAGVEPPNCIIFDSLAATPARAELAEKAHSDAHVALQAKANTKGVRVTLRSFSNSDIILILINQLRDKIGAFGHGPKTDTPGGRALKYAYAIRLKLAKIESLKNKADDVIGHVVQVETVKNKHAPQFQKCELALSYRRGIDVPWSNFLWFQKHKYIAVAGRAGFKFEGVEEAFKRVNFAKFCEDHPVTISGAVADIYAKLEGQSAEVATAAAD